MNDLITTDKKTIELLPENLKQFSIARIGQPSFKSLNITEQKRICLDVITNAHYDLGYEKNTKATDLAQILEAQSLCLIKELNSRYGTLTQLEIKEAFRIGLRKEFHLFYSSDQVNKKSGQEFGYFYGLCSATYAKFLKLYFELPQRSLSQLEYLKLIEANTFKRAEKPIAIKITETKESIIKAFEHYKLTKELPYTAFAYYDFLWKEMKLISWTKEERALIIAEAEKEYVSSLKVQKASGKLKAKDYEDIVSNLAGESNRTFINKVKKLSLKKYFDNLINENKNLEL